MKSLLFFSVSILLIMSCSKDKESPMPHTPGTDTIDIDNDSKVDFVIEYSTIENHQSSNYSITGHIKPLNENQVLFKNPEGNLFLKIKDTISKEDTDELRWSNYGAYVVFKDGYKDKWMVVSEKASNYFLGFKLVNDTSESIGWMLLDFNLNNGIVTVLDQEISQSDKLVINY